MQDLSSFLQDAKIFSKIAMTKGYYQVPMEEADIPKTAIVTPFGMFEFLFMPFGLAQVFQHLMDSLFHSFPFMFVYLTTCSFSGSCPLSICSTLSKSS
jgi:hypothetical protein